MSKSASLPAEPFENSPQSTAAWKAEVNQRLAAHRNRRGGADASAGQDEQNTRQSSGRAADAAARVAARYAKAPSYSKVLADEARAAVRAAEAAAEAALTAHAAAQAVLDGLENRPLPPHLWQPVSHEIEPQEVAPQKSAWQEDGWQERVHEGRFEASRFEAAPEMHAAPLPSRWQDAPPVVEPVVAAAPEVVETPRPWPGAQPRWEEGLTPPAPQDVWAEMRVHRATDQQSHANDRHADDPRIYRQARASQPLEHDHAEEESELFEMGTHMVEPVQVSHANLIEFPRELVATRKARPRLAEGPLYTEEENQQLNIFESIPEVTGQEESVISVEPARWASIELDHPIAPVWHEQHPEQVHAYAHAPEMPEAAYAAAPAHHEYETGYEQSYEPPHAVAGAYLAAEAVGEPARRPMVRETPVRQQAVRLDAPPEMLVATFSDRVLAGLVDGALVTLAFLAAAVVVLASTAHPPIGRMALVAAGCGLVLFGILYQLLFLSFTEEGTPGMRYARIALCTFEDENPAVGQMLMRVPATVLAALPAGIGLLWSVWDKDHVGWHDRWTRTYQRKY